MPPKWLSKMKHMRNPPLPLQKRVLVKKHSTSQKYLENGYLKFSNGPIITVWFIIIQEYFTEISH